jgi:hypothetical protein
MAIQSFRQKPRRRRFADAARAAKQIGVMQTVVYERVAQCARDCFLTGNFLESLRSPFSCDDLV